MNGFGVWDNMEQTVFQRLTRATGVSLAVQECLYGFIMALIFVTAAKLGVMHFDDKASFCLVVLGMNITWGAIDAIVFYLMNVIDQRETIRGMECLRRMSEEEAVEHLMNEFEGTALDNISEAKEREICRQIYHSEIEPRSEILDDRRRMMRSSLMCFVITALTVIPVILPVLIIDDFQMGLDVTSFIVSTLLFFIGFYLGRYLGHNGWAVGLFLAGITWAISLISTFTGG